MQWNRFYRIYVAGAYSNPDYLKVFENMRRGIQLSIKALSLGFAPFCPWLDYQYPFFGLPDAKLLKKELNGVLEKIELGEIDISLLQAYSIAWLDVCDAVLVNEGWENSKGTKAEIERAEKLNIPVFYSLADMVSYFIEKEKQEKDKFNLIQDPFDRFVSLVRDQWEYGGKKYALGGSNERESTDVLFDIFGKGWYFGTLSKYCKRWNNLGREKDVLKVGCYSYLGWLKRGCFREDIPDTPLDTNIEMKAKYFMEYINRYKNADMEEYNGMNMDDVFNILSDLNNRNWIDITERNFLSIFHICFNLWFENYIDVTDHDTDTYNEEK